MSVTKRKYDELKSEYGLCSSWAIWDDITTEKKSFTGGMEWVKKIETELNEKGSTVLINTDFMFVALNCSEVPGLHNSNDDWTVFHSANSKAKDYKLRDALKNSKYWGSYICDVIKGYEKTESGDVMKEWRHWKKDGRAENVAESFFKEYDMLGKPLVVAMGNSAYKILCDIQSAHSEKPFELKKIYHYSCQISNDKYFENVHSVLNIK